MVIELRVFAILLKYCSQMSLASVRVWQRVTNWQLKRKLTTKIRLAKQMLGMFYDGVFF